MYDVQGVSGGPSPQSNTLDATAVAAWDQRLQRHDLNLDAPSNGRPTAPRCGAESLFHGAGKAVPNNNSRMTRTLLHVLLCAMPATVVWPPASYAGSGATVQLYRGLCWEGLTVQSGPLPVRACVRGFIRVNSRARSYRGCRGSNHRGHQHPMKVCLPSQHSNFRHWSRGF